MADITFVAPDLSSNSLGRVYCLWMLAVANGWTAEVIAPAGDYVWPPLATTAFAGVCRVVDPTEAAAIANDRSKQPRLLICVKALPASVTLFERLSHSTDVPGFLDVDDPDLDELLSWRSPLRRAAKEVLRPDRLRALRHSRRVAVEMTAIVSNPVLQERYGGVVIPHVRDGVEPGLAHESTAPQVAFVGTIRAHKGIEVLREAIAELRGQGYSLVLTDDAPPDSRPWERWVGRTSLAEGIQLVRSSDVIVIPSLRTTFAVGQLPVKLIDAMLAARPVVASSVDPLPWALAGAGLIVEPGSVEALVAALASLRDPDLRTRIGRELRLTALARYTVQAQRTTFSMVCERAMRE